MKAAVLAAVLAATVAGPCRADRFEDLTQRAAQARNGNRDEDAIELYRQALDVRPSWTEGLWYLGTLLYDKEQFADARDDLRRFVATDASAGPGWVLLGMSEFKTREYGRSLDHLQRGLALGLGDRPELANSAFYLIGALLTRFEEYDKSAALLTRMAETSQPNAFLVEAAGLAALRRALLPAEIPADGRDLVRLSGEGVCALAAHDHAAAEKDFRQMVAAYPNEPGVHFLFGAFLMPDRPEQGVAEMKRELDISPDHVAARVRLALQYMQQGELDIALTFAAQAISLEPRFAPAHRAMGEALLAKGEVDKAIQELETARTEEPDVIETRLALFRAYTAANRDEAAAREKVAVEKLEQANQ
jgi:tetratricopeptide (TPR) repeat protein